jgi:hypothetical protein
LAPKIDMERNVFEDWAATGGPERGRPDGTSPGDPETDDLKARGAPEPDRLAMLLGLLFLSLLILVVVVEAARA